MLQIDWVHFTPWSSLVGGMIIGLATTAFLLFLGRIAGISGIVGGLLQPIGDKAWRWAFLGGLLVSSWVYQIVLPLPVVHVTANTPMLIVAGLLVGIGTRYGSGCTSGHGICGLSRLSGRSLVATLAFMGAGFVMIGLLRHFI